MSFSGQAEISAELFAEEGQTRMGEATLASRRSYHLTPDADGVTVFFPDRRLFVAIGDAPSQTVFHQCGADAYSGRFLFRSPDEWVEAWQVRGPRKNYRSLAVYRRAQ